MVFLKLHEKETLVLVLLEIFRRRELLNVYSPAVFCTNVVTYACVSVQSNGSDEMATVEASAVLPVHEHQ